MCEASENKEREGEVSMRLALGKRARECKERECEVSECRAIKSKHEKAQGVKGKIRSL